MKTTIDGTVLISSEELLDLVIHIMDVYGFYIDDKEKMRQYATTHLERWAEDHPD